MKKIIAAAAGLMMVGTLASSASAVESQFGGYWRTRAFTQVDFDGEGNGSFARTDTRTRLFYTAVFNENFKFVNKFEFNSVFGDNDGGDIGTDGDTFRVKQSYADFTINNVRLKVGTQAAAINRGFIFDDDFAGVYVGAQATDQALLQFVWVKVDEEEIKTTTTGVINPLVDADGDGFADTADTDTFQEEIDIYSFLPVLKVSDQLTVTPTFTYAKTEGQDSDLYWIGADVDFSTDAFSLWGTGIYFGGELEATNPFVTGLTVDEDVSAYLLAAGGSFGMFHGEVFYASGDDDDDPGDDVEVFLGAPGQSYYWSEIMGLGIFDNQGSEGSPENAISNIFAANLGVKTKVTDKLTVGADLWYAMLAEDDAAGEDALGFEIDLKATYAIMDNLKLDLVAAYLLADDATSPKNADGDPTGDNDEDPIEIGARLSLSF